MDVRTLIPLGVLLKMHDVLVLDSGVGGLSIVREVERTRPDLSTCYLADLAQLPYGEKTEPWLVDRLTLLLNHLLPLYNPRAVVLACNTASTTVLPELRARFSIPVVGVVPAIKPAGLYSKNRCIGLLATPGTVGRPYIKELMDQFAPDCELIAIGSSELVQMAECKLRGLPFNSRRIVEICQGFLSSTGEFRPDHVILGCTHFPHLQDEFKKSFGEGVTWLDSGSAIAARVSSLIPSGLAKAGEKCFLSTKKVDQHLRNYLYRHGFEVSETVLL